ncbi:MAG TPA: PTS sugar transporter subunit IIA [Firmicutes bacterium]|nr:PTS sugar transporter subunit IIA [Bacillota bacterium]
MSQFIIDESLVIGPFRAKDNTEAITYVAQHLVRLGHVKSSYPHAVIAREQEFPTGLSTGEIGVAIPHCDSEHVIEPAVAVAILDAPVQFRAMDDNRNTVSVDIILMLAIKDPSTQIDILRRVSGLVQSPAILKSLKMASSHTDIIKILRSVFQVPETKESV